ncbi:hypothetical protein Tco_0417448 [Tanacetum coccineum]
MGGDGGGDDRPPSHHIPTGCGGCLGNRGKGTRKPNLGGRRAGKHTRQETQNLGLKAITDKSGPVPIRFEFGDRETLMPLDEHVRELPLHYPSWHQVPAEQKAGVMARIGMEEPATREYPSLIHTFLLTHTVNGVFLNPEDKALYMLSYRVVGSNTEMVYPIPRMRNRPSFARQAAVHDSRVGRVLPGQGTVIPPPPPCTHSSDVVKLKKREKVLTRQVNMFMKLFRSDDKFSQMLSQLESQPEIGGGSGSGGCGDDEQGDDEDDGEDGEDEDDS